MLSYPCPSYSLFLVQHVYLPLNSLNTIYYITIDYSQEETYNV